MPDGLPDLPTEMLESIGDAVEAPEAPTAVETTNQPPVETTATPEGETTEETTTDAPDSFTRLDPTAIPDELRPYYESMQADYTRKTQDAAPWRKLGEELGVSSPDDVRQAAELYAYLQDPNNLALFHAQLGEALGQTAAPAAPAVTPPAETLGGEFDSALDDPAVSALQARLDAFEAREAKRNAEQQNEALQWALLGEMNRQEALIKEEHPDWGEDEWTGIWNLAPTFNGDLVQAAAVVDAAANARVVRLLNGKAAVEGTEGLTTMPPRIAVDAPPAVDGEDYELKGPTARAIEYMKQVVAQSE